MAWTLLRFAVRGSCWHALEEINDALVEEGRRATAVERTQVDGQLAKQQTLLLGVSAIAQDN